MLEPKLRFTIPVLCSALLLGACNALQVLQGPDDKAIASEVQARLFQDPVLKTRDIRVDSQKGVVTLAGTVETELEKGAAERLAGQAGGVKQVLNQLTVSQVPTARAAVPATPAEPETAALLAERPRPPKHSRRPQAYSEPAASAPPPAVTAKPAEPAAAPAPVPPASPPPVRVTIPSGTVFTVRMIDSVDSSRNHAGDEFNATVESPIVVDSRVVVPHGADARVRLVSVASAGRMTGRSALQLELVGLSFGGSTYTVQSGYYEQHGASRGKRSAETIGGGAGLGALIGAIAGKGKGAAIGAAVGAGAGTAVEAATRGQQVKVPSETKIDFTLKAPITVTVTP